MRPLGFLTGIVLGSATSIALVLAMIVVIFALSAGRHPEISREYPALLTAAGLFGGLAAVAGAAFVGLERRRAWSWPAQLAMWLMLAAIGWHYWPKGR